MLLRERLGLQFNNCSVPDKSLDFLPVSPPDLFPVDIQSSDTFPFPDPLLGSNAWILASRLFPWCWITSNTIKFHSFFMFFFLCFDRHTWTDDYMVKDGSRFTFSIMLDMVLYAFLTQICTLIKWLPAFLTRRSRKWSRSLHDVTQNIWSMDSIE
jgi:hypothetical protein